MPFVGSIFYYQHNDDYESLLDSKKKQISLPPEKMRVHTTHNNGQSSFDIFLIIRILFLVCSPSRFFDISIELLGESDMRAKRITKGINIFFNEPVKWKLYSISLNSFIFFPFSTFVTNSDTRMWHFSFGYFRQWIAFCARLSSINNVIKKHSFRAFY